MARRQHVARRLELIHWSTHRFCRIAPFFQNSPQIQRSWRLSRNTVLVSTECSYNYRQSNAFGLCWGWTKCRSRFWQQQASPTDMCFQCLGPDSLYLTNWSYWLSLQALCRSTTCSTIAHQVLTLLDLTSFWCSNPTTSKPNHGISKTYMSLYSCGCFSTIESMGAPECKLYLGTLVFISWISRSSPVEINWAQCTNSLRLDPAKRH